MNPDDAPRVLAATEILGRGGVLVLTGAGISTDSGIPDYRGPGSTQRRPMTYADFTSHPIQRQRYWARSHVGWNRMTRAVPNTGHHAVAQLERLGLVDAVITQNVDRLHAEAGSRSLVELHGRIDHVICLGCGEVTSRADLDERLADLNPGWRQAHAGEAGDVAPESAPDGDAVIEDSTAFVVADCLRCGGTLKPDLVFFGENVPVPRVTRCYELVERARALVVAGSSLTVFSGRRFVRRAYERDIPVVIINRGPTRGDALAGVRIDEGCSQVLEAMVESLRAAAVTGS